MSETSEHIKSSSEQSDDEDAWLPWLSDAPLFIDKETISSFYDAVVRPESETDSVTLTESQLKSSTALRKLGGGIEATLFFVKAQAEGGGEKTEGEQSSSDKAIVLRPVNNPYRQLVHLILHYAVERSDRVLFVKEPQSLDWAQPDFILAAPRALLVLDLGSDTILLPTAAEVGDKGKVVLFFERLQDPEKARDYPRRSEGDDVVQRRREYWASFIPEFDAQKAMVALEELVAEAGGRIRWIDYRLFVGQEGDTIHLHLQGNGQYDAGVFAYNMIKRGNKHGLRIIGTLKAEPDVHVLAVFEK